jgi:hypothetical protein
VEAKFVLLRAVEICFSACRCGLRKNFIRSPKVLNVLKIAQSASFC